jgi:Tfp pilus assembly protein PilN
VRAVNLIPVEQRSGSGPAAGRSEGGAYAVLVLLAGLALLALLYGQARHQISTRRAQVESLTSQTHEAEAKAARLTPYTSFLELREKRVQAVSQLAQSRFDWAYAFRELGRVLPADVSITSLSGVVGSGTSTPAASSHGGATTGGVASATPPGSVPTFTLIGCTSSQTEVAHTLVNLRLINGVSNVALSSSTKGGAGGGAGGAACPAEAPSFTVLITFDPLPSASAASATSAASVSPAPSAGPSGSPGGAR